MKDNCKSNFSFEMKTSVKQKLFLLIFSLLLTFELANSSPESSKYLSNRLYDQKILNSSENFEEPPEKKFFSISINAEKQRQICATR